MVVAQEWLWGSVSCGCKLDLIAVMENLNRQSYQRDFIEASVMPHFVNQSFFLKTVFMDENGRPYCARVFMRY